MRCSLFVLMAMVPLYAGDLPVPLSLPVPKVQVLPLPNSVSSFHLEGKELTAVHFDPADQRPYWYPILSSQGVSLTRMGHPHDPVSHSHHNSVWITNAAEGLAGISLMNHPGNPGNPTAFRVRGDGWMGACLTPEKPLIVTETQKLRVRYGRWVHDGIATQAQSEAHWKVFADLPLADLDPKRK